MPAPALDRLHLHDMRKLARLVLIFFCSFLFASDEAKLPELKVEQPQVDGLFPLAAQPGQRLRVEIKGENLDELQEVWFEGKGIEAAVLESKFTTGELEFQISEEAEPGNHYFRVVSARGPSNLTAFRVTDWPCPQEEEPNDRLDSPTEVSIPSLINARLSSTDDVDFFRFSARAGERIQFNLLGARNWTSADASLAIVGTDGREIVHDEGRLIWDPYIVHTFEETGDYLAAVTVTRMPAGGQSRYNLNYLLGIGQAPFLWSAFPLGARLGTESELRLRGDFLEKASELNFKHPGVEFQWADQAHRTAEERKGYLKVAEDAATGFIELFLNETSGSFTPSRFAISDLPERPESESNDRMSQAEPFSYPGVVNGRIGSNRDEDWFRLKLQAGETLSIIVDAEKLGSLLDAHLTLLDSQGETLAQSDDEKWPGRPSSRDPLLTHQFEEAGEYCLRIRSLYHLGGEDFVYRLTVRPSRPQFAIELSADRFVVPQGGQAELKFSILRQEGFEGEVSVQAAHLPQGVISSPVSVPVDKNGGSLKLTSDGSAPLQTKLIRVLGRSKEEKTPVHGVSVLPPPRYIGSGPGFRDYRRPGPYLTVAEAPDFDLDSAARTVYLVRGGRSEFGVRIMRAPGLTSSLDLTLENLPPQVTVEDVELVDEGRSAKITLAASGSAPKAQIENVVVVGRATEGSAGRQESTPKILLQVD